MDIWHNVALSRRSYHHNCETCIKMNSAEQEHQETKYFPNLMIMLSPQTDNDHQGVSVLLFLAIWQVFCLKLYFVNWPHSCQQRSNWAKMVKMLNQSCLNVDAGVIFGEARQDQERRVCSPPTNHLPSTPNQTPTTSPHPLHPPSPQPPPDHSS